MAFQPQQNQNRDPRIPSNWIPEAGKYWKPNELQEYVIKLLGADSEIEFHHALIKAKVELTHKWYDLMIELEPTWTDITPITDEQFYGPFGEDSEIEQEPVDNNDNMEQDEDEEAQNPVIISSTTDILMSSNNKHDDAGDDADNYISNKKIRAVIIYPIKK